MEPESKRNEERCLILKSSAECSASLFWWAALHMHCTSTSYILTQCDQDCKNPSSLSVATCSCLHYLQAQGAQQASFDGDGQVQLLQRLRLELQVPELHVAAPYRYPQRLGVQAGHILAQVLVEVERDLRLKHRGCRCVRVARWWAHPRRSPVPFRQADVMPLPAPPAVAAHGCAWGAAPGRQARSGPVSNEQQRALRCGARPPLARKQRHRRSSGSRVRRVRRVWVASFGCDVRVGAVHMHTCAHTHASIWSIPSMHVVVPHGRGAQRRKGGMHAYNNIQVLISIFNDKFQFSIIFFTAPPPSHTRIHTYTHTT